uniref:Activin_recp domain-containing protein n=1 Tax=Steinernema glaseri TaxID=37863 RepID=A0A1I8ABX8_9BILA
MTSRHLVPIAAFLVFCAFTSTSALECYTGFSYIRGQSLGTTKETCRNKGDFCYKFTAEANVLNKLKQAGCSTLRCMLSHNKCITQKISGHQVKLCCCNDYDLCNSASSLTLTLPVVLSLSLASLLAFL